MSRFASKDVAHDIALQVERQISNIDEEELAASALRAQRRNQMPGVRGSTDLETLRQEALDDRLRRVVVNTEILHASQAPNDFNEDAMKAGAYEMGTGQPPHLPPKQ